VCHVGGLSGFALWYDCTDDQQTLESMKQQLDEALTRDCPWLATPGNCKPLPPTCPVFPSATFPPCLSITSTTTTTTPGACLGKPKDIFIAIDASQSVKKSGWKAEVQFANGLVQALIGNGNPTGHRINVHWFNGITSPLTAPSQIVEPTGGNENQTDPSLNANDIGTWISFSDEVPNLQTKIEELDYSEIRHGATDHPQVYKTADYAFVERGEPDHEQMLISSLMAKPIREKDVENEICQTSRSFIPSLAIAIMKQHIHADAMGQLRHRVALTSAFVDCGLQIVSRRKTMSCLLLAFKIAIKIDYLKLR